jgi:hypothetical protein
LSLAHRQILRHFLHWQASLWHQKGSSLKYLELVTLTDQDFAQYRQSTLEEILPDDTNKVLACSSMPPVPSKTVLMHILDNVFVLSQDHPIRLCFLQQSIESMEDFFSFLEDGIDALTFSPTPADEGNLLPRRMPMKLGHCWLLQAFFDWQVLLEWEKGSFLENSELAALTKADFTCYRRSAIKKASTASLMPSASILGFTRKGLTPQDGEGCSKPINFAKSHRIESKNSCVLKGLPDSTPDNLIGETSPTNSQDDGEQFRERQAFTKSQNDGEQVCEWMLLLCQMTAQWVPAAK